MKKILNTLYVTNEKAYLALDGENVVIQENGNILGRLPIHTIDSIVVFGYVDLNKSLVFLKPSGRFLAKVTGKSYGNILLRREQYRICDDKKRSLDISKNIISAKILNSNAVVSRTVRDHGLRIDNEKFNNVSKQLKKGAELAYDCSNFDSLRGIEGECATGYFSVFDDMILQQKEDFFYKSRSRRPPMDNVNALLSFTYSLLTSMCVSALETVGLDPYAGFFHTERPGRCSLALDLVEEFRAALADRFVLTLINRKMISYKDFVEKESGGIILKDESRKKYLAAWQNRKKEIITHPFLQEKVEWGMLPYIQAMLLSKYIRGDIDGYPPFIWK